MDDEDNSFFILVLGVLAAIIAMICWWYVSGGIATPVASQVVAAETHADDDGDHSDDGDDGQDHSDVDADEEAMAEPEAEPEPEPTEEPADEPEPAPAAVASTVFDAIAGDGNLSVVSGLLREQSLDGVLTGEGPFTVFAPSDDAVSAAASSDVTVELLSAAPDQVLSYHVVTGTYSAEDLVAYAQADNDNKLVTVQGEPLDIALDADENIVINGNTVIVAGSAQSADNGVVHTLDNVLVPPVAALNTLVGLEPILFDSGSATINQESFPLLDQLVEVLSVGAVDITIEGHTDSQGDPVLNQNLSQARARSVVNYLVASGIEENQLTAVGFGADEPVADNSTEEGRALNRRIEFTRS